MVAKNLVAPYLPQMKNGVITDSDIALDNKIYIEILWYQGSSIGDEIRLYFGDFLPIFKLITDPLKDFPIVIDLDADTVPDGRYLVRYTAIDFAGNVSSSPISWAIVDRKNIGNLVSPVFINANDNNEITEVSVIANHGTNIMVPVYQDMAVGESVIVIYWTLDQQGIVVPGSSYSIEHEVEVADLVNGFQVLVPASYIMLIDIGVCQDRYIVARSAGFRESSKIASALLRLRPVTTLPAPIYVDNVDGWLTVHEITQGIRLHAAYNPLVVGDNVHMQLSGFDTHGSSVPGAIDVQTYIITAIDIINGFASFVFPASLAHLVRLGRFDASYIVSNTEGSSTSFMGSVQIDTIHQALLPPPIFIQAHNGELSSNDVTATMGAQLLMSYPDMAAGDMLSIIVIGTTAAGLPAEGSNWQASWLLTQENINVGHLQLIMPETNVLAVGERGVLSAYYTVRYVNSQGFSYSTISKVTLSLKQMGAFQLMLTTGAPPSDYNAVHLNPLNHGLVIGQPGNTIILSCSRPAEFFESGSTDHTVTLDEGGYAHFRLLSAQSGTVVVDGYMASNPNIESSAMTQFKAYHSGQSKFIAWGSTTNAPNDGIIPCSVYLITDKESDLRRPITYVRVTVTGSANILGYPGQIADILLNEDKSVEIDITNKVAELVSITLTLPESSGSTITETMIFREISSIFLPI